MRVGAAGASEGTTYIHMQFRAGWEASWTDRDRSLTLRMPDAAGTASFNVDGTRMPQHRAVIGIGTESGFTDNFNLFLDYEARVATGLLENSLSLGFRATW